MSGQPIECALTVRGPGDHVVAWLVCGTIVIVALCLLLAWWILARKEARITRLDEQTRHMADDLVRLRRELDATQRAA